MFKRRFIAVVVAALSVCLLATPASAKSKTVFSARGKSLTAVITDCPPANATPGTRCAAWVVDAAKERIRQDGSVDRSGLLAITKFRVIIRSQGFDVIEVAFGQGTPSRLQVADNLSTASVTGAVEVTFEDECDAQGMCRTKVIPVSVSLSANEPLNFQRGKIVTNEDECRIVTRFNDRWRTAEGTATMNGIPFVTTELGPFPSQIFRSDYTTVSRGNCPPPPPV